MYFLIYSEYTNFTDIVHSKCEIVISIVLHMNGGSWIMEAFHWKCSLIVTCVIWDVTKMIFYGHNVLKLFDGWYRDNPHTSYTPYKYLTLQQNFILSNKEWALYTRKYPDLHSISDILFRIKCTQCLMRRQADGALAI